MRHVYGNRQIPHLWAHQSQDTARNSTGSLFFNGKTIYSYGSHFPIARHVSNEAYEHAILFTTKDYSVTTSQHISRVRQAIRKDALVFSVPDFGYIGESSEPETHTHENNCLSYVQRIEEKIGQCARARDSWRRENHHEVATNLLAQFREYVRFFSIANPPAFPVVPELEVLTPKFANARDKQRAIERKADHERREAIRLETEQRNLDKWRAGELIYSTFRNAPVALRINTDTMEVETSLGARVPIEHARMGLAFVRRVVASGVQYVRNGHTLHLGVYAIDRIEVNGTLHAGCHVISYAEIERLAPELAV